MHVAEIMLLAFSVLVVGVISTCIVLNNKSDNKRRLEQSRRLNAEKLKPQYHISFYVDNELKTSKKFAPEREYIIDHIYRIRTSEDMAKSEIDKSFKRGYFQDKDGNMYPVQRVNVATIALEEQ